MFECLKKRFAVIQNINMQQLLANAELAHETSYITSQLFDLKYDKLKKKVGKPSARNISELNEYGQKCL